MKPKTLLLTALVLGLILCPMASAYNVTFANIDGAADRDVLIYHGGTLIGQWNTSSTVSIDNDTVIIFKPQTRDVLEDPGDWLTGVAMPWAKSNFVGLLALAILAGILVRRFL